jgi:hypothetical protein
MTVEKGHSNGPQMNDCRKLHEIVNHYPSKYRGRQLAYKTLDRSKEK